MRSLLPIVGVLGLLLPASALAQGKAQYRSLELTDGRKVTAEVLSTEAVGLLMRSPQGESLVSFEVLLDMAPTDKAAYDNQADWNVYLAAPLEHRETLMEAFGWLDGVQVHQAGDAVNGLSNAQAGAAQKCGTDFACLLGATAEAGWMYVVSVSPNESGGLQVFTGINTGDTKRKFEVATTSRDDLWQLVYQAAMLQVPEDGPPRADKPGKEPRPSSASDFDEAKVVSMSFAPVPGLPSLAQGDAGGFAKAMALVLPGTAVWVGAVGHTTQSVPTTAALGAVGFYATTVAVNQIAGMASLKKARKRKKNR